MSIYAKNTVVSVDKSKAEIESLLIRYGANGFMQGWKEGQAVIGFQAHGKTLRFILPLPDKEAKEFTIKRYGYKRNEAEAYKKWEQACRQSWRALALVIKAKLEAVESNITTFENEFMAHVVMPNGQTIGEWMAPQLEKLQEHKMPPLLPGVN